MAERPPVRTRRVPTSLGGRQQRDASNGLPPPRAAAERAAHRNRKRGWPRPRAAILEAEAAAAAAAALRRSGGLGPGRCGSPARAPLSAPAPASTTASLSAAAAHARRRGEVSTRRGPAAGPRSRVRAAGAGPRGARGAGLGAPGCPPPPDPPLAGLRPELPCAEPEVGYGGRPGLPAGVVLRQTWAFGWPATRWVSFGKAPR